MFLLAVWKEQGKRKVANTANYNLYNKYEGNVFASNRPW